MTPDTSDLAQRIREQLREAHAECCSDGAFAGCALANLWAEDIQQILDMASEGTP